MRPIIPAVLKGGKLEFPLLVWQVIGDIDEQELGPVSLGDEVDLVMVGHDDVEVIEYIMIMRCNNDVAVVFRVFREIKTVEFFEHEPLYVDDSPLLSREHYLHLFCMHIVLRRNHLREPLQTQCGHNMKIIVTIVSDRVDLPRSNNEQGS